MQEQRKKVIILGYVALVLLVLAVTASYAWMSISATPTVTDLALTVVSDNRLEIAAATETGEPSDEWGAILDLSEVSQLQAPLKPATFRAMNNSFYAPDYGWDGRISFQNPTQLTDENGTALSEAEGYLYTCDFWLKTNASDCYVGFSPAIVRENGEMGSGTFVVGEPEWDDKTYKHIETGNGAENAVRVAVFVEETDSEASRWIIYEPAADKTQETLSVDGGPLQGSNRLIRQNPSTWEECQPAPLKESVVYKAGSFIDDESKLFSLKAGQPKHIKIYMWIEGQDPDCQNAIAGGKLFANLQFSGELNDTTSLNAE